MSSSWGNQQERHRSKFKDYCREETLKMQFSNVNVNTDLALREMDQTRVSEAVIGYKARVIYSEITNLKPRLSMLGILMIEWGGLILIMGITYCGYLFSVFLELKVLYSVFLDCLKICDSITGAKSEYKSMPLNKEVASSLRNKTKRAES